MSQPAAKAFTRLSQIALGLGIGLTALDSTLYDGISVLSPCYWMSTESYDTF